MPKILCQYCDLDQFGKTVITPISKDSKIGAACLITVGKQMLGVLGRWWYRELEPTSSHVHTRSTPVHRAVYLEEEPRTE